MIARIAARAIWRPKLDETVVVPACVGGYERRVALVGSREDAYSMRDDPRGDTNVVTMETVADSKKA